MRKLIDWMGVSLDGFIAGRDGEIDWSAPDDELHRFHNQQAGDGRALYGRRLYEVMTPWETADERPSAPEHELEFARIWKHMPKVVSSKTFPDQPGIALDLLERRRLRSLLGTGRSGRALEPGLTRSASRPLA